MNRKKIFVIILIIILSAYIGISYKNLPKSKNIFSLSDENLEMITPSTLVFFSSFGENNFTCTGLSYDNMDNAFWIGDYGAISNNKTPSPRVIQVTADFKTVLSIANIDVPNGANLQGIAYDSSTDTLWLALGNLVWNVNKKGSYISSIDLGKYTAYNANGIAYDLNDDTLWILCYSKYLLHLGKDGTLLKEIPFFYQDQDHIFADGDFLLATVGADYKGSNNYVVKIDKKSGERELLYQVESAFAVEGLCINKNKLYIANDGLYHNANIKKSYIAIYDLELNNVSDE